MSETDPLRTAQLPSLLLILVLLLAGQPAFGFPRGDPALHDGSPFSHHPRAFIPTKTGAHDEIQSDSWPSEGQNATGLAGEAGVGFAPKHTPTKPFRMFPRADSTRVCSYPVYAGTRCGYWEGVYYVSKSGEAM